MKKKSEIIEKLRFREDQISAFGMIRSMEDTVPLSQSRRVVPLLSLLPAGHHVPKAVVINGLLGGAGDGVIYKKLVDLKLLIVKSSCGDDAVIIHDMIRQYGESSIDNSCVPFCCLSIIKYTISPDFVNMVMSQEYIDAHAMVGKYIRYYIGKGFITVDAVKVVLEEVVINQLVVLKECRYTTAKSAVNYFKYVYQVAYVLRKIQYPLPLMVDEFQLAIAFVEEFVSQRYERDVSETDIVELMKQKSELHNQFGDWIFTVLGKKDSYVCEKNYESSLKQYRSALEIQKHYYRGAEVFQIAVTLNNIGFRNTSIFRHQMRNEFPEKVKAVSFAFLVPSIIDANHHSYAKYEKYLADACDACKEAVQRVSEVNEIVPSFQFGEQFHNLGLVYILQGKFKDAIDCFKSACVAYEKSLKLDQIPNRELIFNSEGRQGIALYLDPESSESQREEGRRLILNAWQYFHNQQYNHENHTVFQNLTEWKVHIEVSKTASLCFVCID